GNAELHAASIIGLNVSATAQDAPGACVVTVEARIGGLHVVEHVGEIKVRGSAEPFRDPDSLAEAQIEVPERQATDRKAPNLSVQAENRVTNWIAEDPAKSWAGGGGVAQHVLAGSGGTTAVGAFHALLARGTVVEIVPNNHILVGAHVGRVALA